MELNLGRALSVMSYGTTIKGSDVNGNAARPQDRQGSIRHRTRAARRAARVGVAVGVVGLSVGTLAGALTPGGAYVPVTIIVATVTAVLLGWNLDRFVAKAAERFRPRNGD